MIEFRGQPPSLRKSPIYTKILHVHKQAVLQEEINRMLLKNSIEEVVDNSPGFYSTFFLVPKKEGDWHPILNLEGLNTFIHARTFRMLTPQKVLLFLKQGDWLASIDLKDAYFHVPIYQGHRKYLRFTFLDKVYQFWVLPFGLNTAKFLQKCWLLS